MAAMSSYVIPVYWGTRDQNSVWTVENSGSAFAISFGADPILVTASHVIESYLQRCRETKEIQFGLGPLNFDPLERRIDFRDSCVLDIATFRITQEELASIGKHAAVESAPFWPPEPANVGEGAIFGGFPGRERVPLPCQTISFGFYFGLSPVSSSSERHFGCNFDRNEWVDILGVELPPDGYDLGGLSGGPCFIYHESPSGIISWRLGGIIYNATTTIGEIVLAHHSSFILPTGYLREPI